jgi:hypothetical protein
VFREAQGTNQIAALGAKMPDSSWWGRAKLPPRPPLLAIRRRERLYTLHRDAHEITLEKRDVPAMGEELILSVNNEWRRMRVFRSSRVLLAALTETVIRLSARGWQRWGS